MTRTTGATPRCAAGGLTGWAGPRPPAPAGGARRGLRGGGVGARCAGPGRERQQILVWDVVERRELARLPGSSAAFAGDGRWLATLDEAGVVRVWEVPVRRPWARILAYAAACALGCCVL